MLWKARRRPDPAGWGLQEQRLLSHASAVACISVVSRKAGLHLQQDKIKLKHTYVAEKVDGW
eukprot:scaffold336202_cov17-Prasinocladus_malaysianus.AAC.1